MNHLDNRHPQRNVRNTIWIDLDNSPHVPFFAPIIDALRTRNFSVLITARDCFQVCDLADLLHVDYHKVGRHYGKALIVKLYGMGVRAAQLFPRIHSERPILAVSHGSRSQLLLSQILGIPSVRILDYEYVKNPPLLKATWIIIPELLQAAALVKGTSNTLAYPGIKEDVYVPTFKHDARLRQGLGIGNDELMVTVRPPATEAHYRTAKSDVLHSAAMRFLLRDERVRIVLVPRNEKQKAEARTVWRTDFNEGKIIVPDRVVDGLNLIWNSDLVVSGGGTMNREAAALQVPVYSTFGGTIGAVDRYLESQGRLTLLSNENDIPRQIKLIARNRTVFQAPATTTLNVVVDAIIRAAECSIASTPSQRRCPLV